MARLLSNMVLRGIASSSNNTRVAFGPSFLKRMKFLTKGTDDSVVNEDLPTNGFASSDTHPTKITSDPVTHKDFQSTNKSTGISVLDIVQQDVQNNPVMIYMTGLTDAPQCGFSALAVKVLRQYGKVFLSGQEIDLKLEENVKAHTDWPTNPQIFIKGEFLGGSDIILSMHQKGELKDLLADITGDDHQGRE
ncbi:unnamed protein product [Musa acuminata subsp. burmannicoides]